MMFIWTGLDNMLKSEFKRICGTASIRWLLCGMFVFQAVYSLLICHTDRIMGLINAEQISVQQQEEEDYIYQFHDRVETLYQQNQTKMNSVLYEDTENQLSLQKEQEVLSQLRLYRPVQISSSGLGMIERAMPAWWLAGLLCSVIFLYEFFFLDDSDHLYSLFNTMRTSRLRRGCAKVFCGLIMLSAVYLIKTANDLVTAGIPLNIPVQNAYGHMYTNTSLSMAGYISVLNLRLFAGTGFCLFLMMCLVLLTKSFSITNMIFVPFLSAEFLFYRLISVNSPLRILKDINIFSIITVPESLKDFHVIANTAMSGLWLSVITGMVILGIFIVLSILFYCHRMTLFSSSRRAKRTVRRRSMTRFHLHSVMATHHGLLIIISIFIYCMANALNYSAVGDSAAAVYEQIRSVYYGPVDEQLIARIHEDTENAYHALEKLKSYSESYESLSDEEREEYGRIWEEASKHSYLVQIESDIMALKEAGISVYANHDGISYLIYKDNPISLIQDLLLAVIPLIVIALINCADVSKKEIRKVYVPTETGMKKILHSYEVIFNLTGILLTLTVQSFRYLKISSAYPVSFTSSAREVLLISLNINMGIFCLLCFFALLCLNSAVIHVIVCYFASDH